MLTIKILDLGCTNCRQVKWIARKEVEEISHDAEVIKVTDYKDIKSYNILSALRPVISEKVVCS